MITGPVMAAGEHRFHPECFACTACGAHLEDTEPYALLDRSQLYWCVNLSLLYIFFIRNNNGTHFSQMQCIPGL